jgi:hypothetical protein
MNAKKWKHVLDISQDAIIICTSDELLYHNKAMERLLENANIISKEIITGIDTLFSSKIIEDSTNTPINWKGNKSEH